MHRFFRLGPDLKTYLQFGTVDCCMVANDDVLTIDECSMMIARLLEKIHELCCFATIDSKKKSLLFAGKSVLLFGVLCGSTSTRLSSVRIAGRQEMLRMERFSIGYALVTTPSDLEFLATRVCGTGHPRSYECIKLTQFF